MARVALFRSSIALMALMAAIAFVGGGQASEQACALGAPQGEAPPAARPIPNLLDDFQFEMRNIYTDRQRGARLNVLVRYRYESPENTFDFQNMKNEIKKCVPAGGCGKDNATYWEDLNRAITTTLWEQFPVNGISVRIEVQGMSSGGIASHRASTITIGGVDPWPPAAISFPGCDGMSVDAGNEACFLGPTWEESNPNWFELSKRAEAKAGKHDKPAEGRSC